MSESEINHNIPHISYFEEHTKIAKKMEDFKILESFTLSDFVSCQFLYQKLKKNGIILYLEITLYNALADEPFRNMRFISEEEYQKMANSNGIINI